MTDEPYSYYVCECDQIIEMSYNETIDHLKEVHCMRDPIKFSRELILHRSREPRHSSTHKLNIVGGPVVYQYTG